MKEPTRNCFSRCGRSTWSWGRLKAAAEIRHNEYRKGGCNMKVEIQILSGARQGDSVALEGPVFLVGGQKNCQLYFDPDLDSMAEGQTALFQLDEEGWRVKNVGAGK